MDRKAAKRLICAAAAGMLQDNLRDDMDNVAQWTAADEIRLDEARHELINELWSRSREYGYGRGKL